MKKLLLVLVIGLASVFTGCNDTKDETPTSLAATLWKGSEVVDGIVSSGTLDFKETKVQLTITANDKSETMQGEYTYTKPNFTATFTFINPITEEDVTMVMRGVVEGRTMTTTVDGDTESLVLTRQ